MEGITLMQQYGSGQSIEANMKYLITFIFISVLIGCSGDSFPSYAPLENTLPESGLKIDYNPSGSLTNVQEIQNQLNDKDSEIFIKSLSWYGTESNFGFDYIHGKTAKELVDIVNCLKTNSPEKQKACFN